MPLWVRWLQPLLSGVFTVDNLDYVRRDAYLTGVAVGPVDVERLRRYTFISERGLTHLRAGSRGARDVPDGPAVHVPAGLLPPDGAGDRPRPGRGLWRLGSGDLRRRIAGRAPGGLCGPRRVRVAPPGRPLGTRRGRRRTGRGTTPGDHHVPAAVADTWRASCCAAQAGGPRRRSEPSTRRATSPRT